MTSSLDLVKRVGVLRVDQSRSGLLVRSTNRKQACSDVIRRLPQTTPHGARELGMLML